MYEVELDSCVKLMGVTAQRHYRGCVCVDDIPKLGLGDFAIVNSLTKQRLLNSRDDDDNDEKRSAGHWTVLFSGYNVHEGGPLSYFDSFGVWPQNSDFVKACLDQSEYILYNNICVQNVFASTCPQHILFVIYHWLSGKCLSEILRDKYDITTLSATKNDNIVTEFYNTNFI